MQQLNMQQQQSIGSLWRLPTVETQTGLSKSEIYRRIKLGTFPKPLKLGSRAVAWPSTSIESWVKTLIQQDSK
jgi:prophage regulatory protein